MSGGSYNYLCSKGADMPLEDVRAMRQRLSEMGYTCAARDTEKVINLFTELNDLMYAMHDIWHAVEWYDSNDYDLSSVTEAIDRKYGKE